MSDIPRFQFVRFAAALAVALSVGFLVLSA
jgi:hypothetical protein